MHIFKARGRQELTAILLPVRLVSRLSRHEVAVVYPAPGVTRFPGLLFVSNRGMNGIDWSRTECFISHLTERSRASSTMSPW
jgi:hypothetical protein